MTVFRLWKRERNTLPEQDCSAWCAAEDEGMGSRSRNVMGCAISVWRVFLQPLNLPKTLLGYKCRLVYYCSLQVSCSNWRSYNIAQYLICLQQPGLVWTQTLVRLWYQITIASGWDLLRPSAGHNIVHSVFQWPAKQYLTWPMYSWMTGTWLISSSS